MRHASLDALAGRHREWIPWLAVIDRVLDALAERKWHAADWHPDVATGAGVPLLAGMPLEADCDAIRWLLLELARCAHENGIVSNANAWAVSADVAAAAFVAALDADDDRLDRCARDAGAEAQAFRALAFLLPLPLLHACRERWSAALPRAWPKGYCPSCGAWPSHAEVLGIERARHLRCGRCGASWPAPVLRCAFCGTGEHETLGSLVVEEGSRNTPIEVCSRCNGYLKTFVVLAPAPPEQVLIDDLASVALDVAALARGYRRPGGVGSRLRARWRESGRRIAP